MAAIKSCLSITRSISSSLFKNAVRSFSACSQVVASKGNQQQQRVPFLGMFSPSSLLSPTSCIIVPTAGMKQKGKLRRRCKNCFFIMIEERLHVWCDVHPRHKQMQMIQKPKTVIRLTAASQGKIRPW